MPEYLAPGVYVEEVSFRSKTIEGVPTSTTGFAGMARTGPVQYPGGPTSTEPRLVTSFTEFERVYGGLEPLQFPSGERIPYLAHAALAFFLNGGVRLYIERIFNAAGAPNNGVASLTIPVSDVTATWSARWPGAMGNVLVETRIARSGNVAVQSTAFGTQAQRVRTGTVVEVYPGGTPLPPRNAPLNVANACVVSVDPVTGQQSFIRSDGTSRR